MKRPEKYGDVIQAGMEPREFMWNAYKYTWNRACDEWLKWHEELRLALGAQPGDDLIEYAAKMKDFIGDINPQLERTRENEIERLKEQVGGMTDALNGYMKGNENLRAEIEGLKVVVDSRGMRINELEAILEQKDKDIVAWQEVVSRRGERIEKLRAEIAVKSMEIDGWKTTAESRGNLVEELLRKVAEKDDMLDTAAKLIKLQRDAMALLLESVKTEKGEPDES